MKRIPITAAIVSMTMAAAAYTTYGASTASAAPQAPEESARFTLAAVLSGEISVSDFTPEAPTLMAAPADMATRAPSLAEAGTPNHVPYTLDGYRVAQTTGFTSSDAAIVDISTIEDGFMTAANESGVDLSWAAGEAATPVTIYRDGEKITTTSDTSFHDSGVAPGKSYDYRIEHGAVARESAVNLEGEVAAADAHRPDTSSFGATVAVPTSGNADLLVS